MEASIININDIVNVDIIENQPVYDIEVENNHNFYLETNTDKILVHNSGKSDFVDMMVLGYQKLYGWKTAFASPENKPNKIHAGKLLSKIAGKWVHKKSDIDSQWFNKAINMLDDNFKFIDLDGSFDLDDVLDKAKQMIFKYGIKVLVIDPYNKVRLKASINKNINEYTNDYLLKIDEFARKYDVLPIVVAHPRKPSMGEAQQYEPTFYDIKGGGEFYDMSPHGILVHRDYANDMVKVKILKVKFSHLGQNNEHVWLSWNSKSGRYSDYSNQNDKAESTTGLMEDDTNWLDDKPIEQELPILDNKGIEPCNFYEKDADEIEENDPAPF